MKKDQKIEPGGEDPLGSRSSKNYDFTTIRPNIRVFWSWFRGNVFGHPKNLLDFKRQITRSGPLSIF